MFNQSKARTHDVQFDYIGMIICGHCGCQFTAELKKGKYIYYHCTGKRGDECKKDWIREEELKRAILELIGKIPKPGDGLFDMIKKSIKEIRELKTEFDDTSSENIIKQIDKLKNRIDKLYSYKLDGIITKEFGEEKHKLWYDQKEKSLDKLQSLNHAAKTFDEGTNLLENFCKQVPIEFLKASAKKNVKY